MMWKMKRADALLIIVYVVVTIAMALAAVVLKSSGGAYAEKRLQIQVEGKVVKEMTLPVSGDLTLPFKTKLGYNLIKIQGDHVTIVDADCRDKVCVHSGEAREPGDILVCLPHKFIVEIKGIKSQNSQVDSVTH